MASLDDRDDDEPEFEDDAQGKDTGPLEVENVCNGKRSTEVVMFVDILI